MKVEIKNFGDILISRPSGREAGLAIKANFKPKPKERLELDFSGTLAVGPSWLDEVLTILKAEYGERVVCLPSENRSVAESLRVIETQASTASSHPWRLCPDGQYWRSAHVQPTYTRADGTIVRRHRISSGCCENPSKKDQIYSEELKRIARKHFAGLTGAPAPIKLSFSNGNSFDELIRGWTIFWNDVMKPASLLDANFVKALIATESGFDPDVNVKDSPKNGYARGLMQVTDASLKILSNLKGELKDHFVHVNREDINDPVLNIASGVRWLFDKKRLASAKLGHEASWEETVADYKGILKAFVEDPDHPPRPIQNLRKYYRRLVE